MQISTILRPGAVRVVSSATSKKRLFQELGDLAASAYGVDPTRTVELLTERESLGPTGVGHGVALPHARFEELKDMCGAFVLLDKPVDFSAPDRAPVDLVFALFAPENAGVDHLKALALVSRTLKDAALCAKLRANNDPAALFAILTEAERSKAA